jgi:hypothetical protein
MNTEKIYNENGIGFTRTFSTDKVEKVNPIEYYKTLEVEKRAIMLRDLLEAQNPFLSSFLNDEFFKKEAIKTLDDFFENIENTEVHENFLKLLYTTRKKKQTSLLKGMSLNVNQLMSLIFKSYSDFSYLYSSYLFENLPNGFDEKKIPKYFYLKEDGTVEKVGETDLSDGELKHIIEHRKKIFAHFFEKDGEWHCFFVTYKSIGGKENWKNGQPHFHYISSAFGIRKDDFIESLRTGNYKSTSIHIDLLDYGKESTE